MAKRYFEQKIPYQGVEPIEFISKMLLLEDEELRLTLRYRVLRRMFSLRGGNVTDTPVRIEQIICGDFVREMVRWKLIYNGLCVVGRGLARLEAGCTCLWGCCTGKAVNPKQAEP